MVKYVILVCISGCLLACTEKLDLKPDESKLIPKTIEDFQALLDAPNINDGFPAYGEGGADNYYITDSRFNSLSWIEDRSAYIWKDQIYSFTSLAPDWSWSYSRVSNSNLVLEGLDELKSESGSTTYNGLKGSALFLRACTFYTLAEIFCKPYDSTSANTDLGIPLRTSSDINIIFQRSSLQDTYDRIISDLNTAVTLLPEFSLTNSRPSRAAAYGLLARIYLTIGDYESAINNAEKSLQIRHDVLDYNTVEGNEDFPFKPDNNDVLFYGIMAPTGLLRISTTFVDTFLYKQFEENDLRKELFFGEGSSGKLFKGSYSGEANSYF